MSEKALNLFFFKQLEILFKENGEHNKNQQYNNIILDKKNIH